MCWEPILAEATVCPHCRNDVLFDVRVNQKTVSSRAAYHGARSLESVEGQPLDFLSLKQNLANGPGIVVQQVSRAIATNCLELLEEQGIVAELIACSGPRERRRRISLNGLLHSLGSLPQIIRKRPGTALSVAVAVMLAAAAGYFGIRNHGPLTSRHEVAITMQELAAIAEQTTVRLRCGDNIGAGFFVGDDLVVTNEHVLCDDENRIEVTFIDGRTAGGKVLRRDEWLDAALLRVDDTTSTPLRIVDATTLERGSEVFLMGSPHGLDFSFSQGIISHPNRALMGISYLQIDAGVNPGNSGGPLLDQHGNAVGIVSMRVGSSDNLGLALPLNYLLEGPDAMLPEDEVQIDGARWEARVQAAAESNRKEVTEARAELTHPGLMEVQLVGSAGVVAVVARWSNSRPSRENFEFELETPSGTSCSPSGGATRWERVPVGAERELGSRYVMWLEKHGLMRDMYISSFRLTMSGCPGPSSVAGATIRLKNGAPSADRATIVRRPS